MTTETETDAFLRRCKHEKGIAPILSSALLGRWDEIMGKAACWAWSDFQAIGSGGWRLYGDTLYMRKAAQGRAIGASGKLEMWQWDISGRKWFAIREIRPNDQAEARRRNVPAHTLQPKRQMQIWTSMDVKRPNESR